AVAHRNREVRTGLDKTRALVSNYERLTAMKMDRQRSYYENRIAETVLRYNPHFSNRELRRIIRRARKGQRPVEHAYTPDLQRGAALTRAEFDLLKARRRNYYSLLDRLHRVPYRNSVAPGLIAMDRDSSAVMRTYDRLWLALTKTLRQRDREIGSFRYSLEYYARIVPEAGYVVDARNPQRVRTYLKRVLRVKGGQTARVFRRDTEFIARIEFLPGSSGK